MKKQSNKIVQDYKMLNLAHLSMLHTLFWCIVIKVYREMNLMKEKNSYFNGGKIEVYIVPRFQTPDFLGFFKHIFQVNVTSIQLSCPI